MPEWTDQDISRFQKLYLEYYHKKIDKVEADIKITALVELLNLSIKVENSRKNNPNENLSEPE